MKAKKTAKKVSVKMPMDKKKMMNGKMTSVKGLPAKVSEKVKKQVTKTAAKKKTGGKKFDKQAFLARMAAGRKKKA